MKDYLTYFILAAIAGFIIFIGRLFQKNRAICSINKGRCGVLKLGFSLERQKLTRETKLQGPVHCSYCLGSMFLELKELDKRNSIICPYCEIILLIPETDWNQMKVIDCEPRL